MRLVRVKKYAEQTGISTANLTQMAHQDRQKGREPERFKKIGTKLFVDVDEFERDEKEQDETRELYYKVMEHFKTDWELAEYLAPIFGQKASTIYAPLHRFSFSTRCGWRDKAFKAFNDILDKAQRGELNANT